MEITLDNIDEVAEQKATTGDAPTEKQVRFLRALIRGAMISEGSYNTHDDPELVIEGAGGSGATRQTVSKAIDMLLSNGTKPVWDAPVAGQIGCTPKQEAFLKKLSVEKGVEIDSTWLATTATASAAIDKLLSAPSVPVAPVDVVEAPEGMHRLGEEIYKVQIAHHGSGRPYAKRLVVDGDNGSFVYAAGVVSQLSEETLMTLDEAKSFGALYGVCVRCGRTLTDEDSIAAGIGPVCSRVW